MVTLGQRLLNAAFCACHWINHSPSRRAAALFGGVLLLFGAGRAMVRRLGSELWAIRIVDVVVVGATLGVGLAVVCAILVVARLDWGVIFSPRSAATAEASPTSHDRLARLAARFAPALGASLGLMLTVFVAYAALRNQSRLTAEIAIVADGGRIADWERESAEVRCLYDWFDELDGAVRPRTSPGAAMADACLARIVADRDTYSEVMLYIEEAFFILRQAKRDQDLWGSNYYEEVKYWQSDISEDVTGLFAFHLLKRYPFGDDDTDALDAAEVAMKAAGVDIANLCAGARRVQVCLSAVGRRAGPLPPRCNARTPISDVRLVRLAAACRAEAAKPPPSASSSRASPEA